MKRTDKSFASLLGNSPTAKTWQYLMVGRYFAYHISDIARATNISRPTVYTVIRDLRKKGVVTVEGKKQGATLYKLNQRLPEVRVILRAFQQLPPGMKYESPSPMRRLQVVKSRPRGR